MGFFVIMLTLIECFNAYSGDAFLALWKLHRDSLDYTLMRVIKCGLRIQERCDNRETEVGVKLRVKLGQLLTKQAEDNIRHNSMHFCFVVVMCSYIFLRPRFHSLHTLPPTCFFSGMLSFIGYRLDHFLCGSWSVPNIGCSM